MTGSTACLHTEQCRNFRGRLTKRSVDRDAGSCESRKVIASRVVVAFPNFDRYGDHIQEWIAALAAPSPGVSAAARIAKDIRRVAAEVERVRNSLRHGNLANALWHAANALDTGEWVGARYLLITAFALMAGCAVRGASGVALIQFPVAAEATTVKLPAGVVTGIATG